MSQASEQGGARRDPPQTETAPEEKELPFLSHLVELRDRLLRVVLVVAMIFLGLFYFANDLYSLLAQPLLAHMPEGTSMIATEVASPFLTPFKLTLVASVFAAMPFILYQAWAFIAPGLYKHERRLALPLVASSILLFYLGMAFAYFVVFPLVFGFFTSVAPTGVEVMTDIARYLDFVLKLFFAFGIAFEVPIATIILVVTDMTTTKSLAAKRPYIIVGAFVIGMLLTPPDIISQTLLALPMWLLFELGLFFSRWVERGRKEREEAGEDGQAAGETPPSEEQMEAELDQAIAEEERLDTGSAGAKSAAGAAAGSAAGAASADDDDPDADEPYIPADHDPVFEDDDDVDYDEEFDSEPDTAADKDEHEPDQPEPDQPEPDQPVPDKPEPDKPEPDKPEPDKPEPDQPVPDKPEPDKR